MSTPPSESEVSAKSEALPLVYISYAHADQVWLDKLLVWLKPLETAVQLQVYSDRSIEAGQNWEKELRTAAQKAALGIILLSPDWLASDYGVQVELPVLSSRLVIPVLVRECNWPEVPEVSKLQILSADGKPLSGVRRAKQDRTFQILIERVRKLLGMASESGFSPNAEHIRNVAVLLAASRTARHTIDVEALLFAFLETAQHTGLPGTRTPQLLWDALPDTTRSQYEKLRVQRFPLFSEKTSARVDRPDLDVYGAASGLSTNTSARGVIHVRHLLAALLMDPEAKPIFQELALDLGPFRKDFLAFVLKSVPEEPEEYWKQFLTPEAERDSEAQPDGATADSLAIASYQSDDWKGRDLLNIRRDVNALAALVSGWNVQPPLSIGLFGEWGSGKSFFMRKMRKRVKQLALAAQGSGKPQRECAYYKNIAQIEFNAWHYMGGDNLWACLVEHIFSHLGLPQDTTARELEERQKIILAKIDAERRLGQQAAGRKMDLEARKQEAEARARQARTEINAKRGVLDREKAAVWETVKSELAGAAVEEILNKIPAAVKLQGEVRTIQEFGAESQTLAGRVGLQWKLLRNDPARRQILFWIIGGSVATYALVIAVPQVAPNLRILLEPVFRVSVPIASALAVTAARFRPLLRNIRQVVSFFEQRNRQITEAVAKAESLHKERIAELEGDVRRLDESIKQAVQEQKEHEAGIAALEKELADTDANKLLADFIRSRVDADDYRKHLGTVALVRRDFERLSELFHSQRKDEELGRERLDDNTVNRIVLYIDDLDRCPPDKVVDVLQAIHLLLAFPIFVVVVAVDSRWISRCLERCYTWLVPEAPGLAVPRPGTGVTGPVDSNGATAHDYLEKIFQIPFWLAPMDSTACKLLIRGLARVDIEEKTKLRELVARTHAVQPSLMTQAASATGTPGASAPAQTVTPSTPAAAAGGLRPTSTPPPVTEGVRDHGESDEAEPIDLAPRQLDVEESELRKIDQLAGLIGRSPRVAKRFMNCYRLYKARMDEAELKKFLDGQFQDVMEVLAILVGAPSIARVVLNALRGDGSPSQNKQAIELIRATLGDAVSTAEGTEVINLLDSASSEHLRSLGGMVGLVSRFSFESYSEVAGKRPEAGRAKQTKGTSESATSQSR